MAGGPQAVGARAWVMRQQWHDLLFAHWPVAAAALRGVVPAELELDLWDGEGWIGVVPFAMRGIRPRGGFALPWLSATPELNVRTYVKRGGRAGVYFFSLDAASALVVWGARRFFGLPYFRAEMTARREGESVRYASRRRTGEAEFRARYRPTGLVRNAAAGTLEHWLTERYCLHTAATRVDIQHAPWELQPAEADIEINTMTAPVGIALPGRAPLLHFSRLQDVRVAMPAPER